MNTNDIPRKAYTLKEAAKCLGVCYSTMFRLVQRGKIKTAGELRTKLVPASELDRYLKETLK